MASPPISNLAFHTLAFGKLVHPREWQPALVEILRPPESWRRLKLTLQGKAQPLRLECRDGRDVILTNWEHSSAGRYRLCLFEDDTLVDDVTINVLPEKISQEGFEALLDELENDLPTSIAVGLNRLGGLAGVKLQTARRERTVEQEFLHVERALEGVPGRPGLREVLSAIAQDPHKILKTISVWSKTERARRPISSELIQVVGRPDNMMDDHRPKQVVDGRVEHSFDVVENRLVKLFTLQVKGRLRRLLRLTHISKNRSLAARIEDLHRGLERAKNAASFMGQVTLPALPPTTLTMAMLKRPPYRAALEGWLDFNRYQTIRLNLPALDAPLENVPLLYESWGTLRVINSVLAFAADCGFRCERHQLVKRTAEEFLVHVLPDGVPALDLYHPKTHSSMHVVPQQSYGQTGDEKDIKSVSYKQKPDVSVRIIDGDGAVHIILFDAKYKLDGEELTNSSGVADKPLKADIDKMHAYKDAIRGSNNEPVVTYAAILYPGSEDCDFGGIVGALSAVPGKSDALEERIRNVLARVVQRS